MTPSFLMLIAAACIIRFLAIEAKRTFARRVVQLLPRKMRSENVKTLLKEFPEHRPVFRRRVLPFSALQIVFNALSCSVFVSALWFFPPAALSDWDLFFIRYGGLLIVPIALIVDVVLFARLFASTFSRRNDLDEKS